MEKMEVQIPSKKVLVIKHTKPCELKFYLKGEPVSYHVKNGGESMFDIFVKEEGKAVKLHKVFNAKNIGELFINLRTEPFKYFELLTGRKENIGHVVTIYEDGFDLCSTYEYDGEVHLSRCFGIYRNEKRISYSLHALPLPVYEVYNNVNYDYDELLNKAIENPEDIMDELTAKYVFGVNV